MTIPASQLVSVTPQVLPAGGSALSMTGVVLTENARVTIARLGSLTPFPTLLAVQNYFGANSDEAIIAEIYFKGFNNSNVKPASIGFTQYPATAVAAYLRGGAFGLTLAQMQTLNGPLTVVMDGYSHVINTISLASYNSFSAAAAAIQAAFSDPTEASFTGSIGSGFTASGSSTNLTVSAVATGRISVGDTVTGIGIPASTTILSQTSSSVSGASVTASIAGAVMNVTAVGSGAVAPGQLLTGSGVAAGTVVVNQLSGTAGGVGTYTVSVAQTTSSTTVTCGTPGDAGVYVTSAATTASSATCAGLSTVLDVTTDTDHTIAAGQTVTGATVATGTLITSQISGTVGGTGLYRLSGAQQTIVSESMTGVATAPAVTYDSQSAAFVVTSGDTGAQSTAAFATGTLATSLKLTSATGAVLSQGADATTPAAFMAAVTNGSTNWATFMTAFDPDGGTGNAIKLQFSAWVNTTLEEYVYACWDPDLAPGTVVPASSSLGYLLQQGAYDGTELISSPDYNLAAFFCGATASIDWNQRNGRITYAFKGQDGLVPNVTDPTTAANLIANGYNFYGAYATAAQQFLEYQPGSISGAWQWANTYVNQIYFNAQFQLALMLLLQQVRSVPYNAEGYSTIAQSMQDVIEQGLNFGAWRKGVPLSSLQIAEVNNSAGVDIAGILSTQGWYLQILPATAQVRQARGSPPMTFWYMDGGDVQKINLASVAVQ